MTFRSIGEIAAGLVEKAQAKQAEVPEITRPSKASEAPATASSQRQSQKDTAS